MEHETKTVRSTPVSPSVQSTGVLSINRRRKQSKPRQVASSAELENGASEQDGREDGTQADTDHDLKSSDEVICPNCHQIFDAPDDLTGHVCNSVVSTATKAFGNAMDDLDDVEEECVDDDDDMEEEDFRYTDDSPEPDVVKMAAAAGEMLNTDTESTLSKRWYHSATEKWGNIFGGRITEQQRNEDQTSSPYNLSVKDFRTSDGSSAVETSMTSSGGHDQPLQSPTVGFNMAAAAAAMGAMFTLDSSLPPSSKIAILESAVYGLYRQQMIQLELIETLRRQLAVALAAANSVSGGNGSKLSPSTNAQRDNGSSTVDDDEPLTTGCSQSVADMTSSNMADSSLSSLMRFSASATVDTRMAVTSTEAAWPPTLMQSGSGNSESGNRNQQNGGDEHESSSKSSGHVTKLPAQPSGGSLADLTLFKKAKPPNVTVGRISEQKSNAAACDVPMSGSAPSVSGDESGVFKHRCHMCYKVLGSDSALQIHLRSHTGERPYKCNICGNRFTTKGNLKVHFQRHLEQFPNARMNPDPVPEYLDHHLPPATSSLTPAFFERSFQATPAVGMQSPSSADMSLNRSNVRRPETPLKSAGVPSEAASEPNMSAIKMEPRGVAAARPNYIQDQLPVAHDSKPDLTTSALPLTNAIPSSSALSTSKFDGHSTPSPLSALSSMSSALTTSFPPSHHHQLSRGLHPTAPQPAVPSTVTPQPIPMHVGGGNGNSSSGAYSPFRVASAAGPGILSPLLKGPLDLDNDEELEQYMEIQSTDTTKIEEMVREATLAAQESSKSEGASIDPNECVLCHRVLSCRSALQMHYRTHTGERPFRCRLCGRTFTTKGNLKTHMTVHRSRNPAFGGTILGNQRCPVCRREFTGSLALQQHIRAAHSTPSVSSSHSASAVSISSSHQPLPPPVAAGVPPFTASLPAGAQNPMVGNAAAVHAAAAAAAAMMMSMPGLNPLLNPFVKFPAAAAALYQGANGPFAQPFPFGASGLGDGGSAASDAIELDLRKTNKSGGVKDKAGVNYKEKRRSDDVDHDEDDEDFENYSEDNVTVNKRRRGNPENIEETSSSSDQVLKFTPRQNDMADAETTAGSGKVSDKVRRDGGGDASGEHKNIGKIISTVTDEDGDGGEFRNMDEWDRNSISQSENSLDQSDKEKFNSNQLTLEESILNLKNRQEERSSPSSRTQLRQSPPLSSDDRQFQTTVESHSGSSCSPTSSPDVAAHRPDSSGNSSCSNRDPVLNYDHQTLPKPTVQPLHHQSTTGSRFACTVCAKPFASASALEIHSRTHSGDRPFICPVCSKAFTTKGNLKVHMGTHAWNRCPSRRGRRMTVVDPTTAAVVAAASVGTTATSGCPPAVGTLPHVTVPASVADFFAAGNTPFGRFVPDISAPNSLPVRPMSVFGFTRPPAAAAGSVAPPAFFPDIAAAAAAWPFINFGGGFLPGPKTSAEQASDSEKLLPSAIAHRNGGEERNNNDAENRNKDDGETRNRSYSSPSSSGSTRLQNGFSPRSTGCESTGGELDLSVGGNIRTTRTGYDVIAPAGCSSTTGQSLQIKGHHRISGASSGNSGWTGASDRGTTMPPLLSNCG